MGPTHLLVHTLVACAHPLATVVGAAHAPSGLARLVAAAGDAAADSQAGRFAVVGDLLVGGVLLIACGALGLRRSR